MNKSNLPPIHTRREYEELFNMSPSQPQPPEARVEVGEVAIHKEPAVKSFLGPSTPVAEVRRNLQNAQADMRNTLDTAMSPEVTTAPPRTRKYGKGMIAATVATGAIVAAGAPWAAEQVGKALDVEYQKPSPEQKHVVRAALDEETRGQSLPDNPSDLVIEVPSQKQN